jgi:hypothetical protein
MMYELVFKDAGGNWSNDGYGDAVVSEQMTDIADAANELLEIEEFAKTEFAVRVIETQQIIHFE